MKRVLVAVSSILIAFSAGAVCVRTGSDVIDMANIECRPGFQLQEIPKTPVEGLQEIPVLMYHQFTSNKELGNEVITPSRFREQVAFLKMESYTTINMHELTEFMLGKIQLPEKTIAITIDDGWRSSLEAARILLDFNSTATFYIITNSFDDPQYLDRGEVGMLSRTANFEIGAHSHTHFMEWINSLSRIDLEIMNYEVSLSKSSIEQVIGKPVTSFSWPFGVYKDASIKYAENLGITSTVMVNNESRNSIGMSPLQVHRINIDGRCTISDFQKMLQTKKVKVCNDEDDKKIPR